MIKKFTTLLLLSSTILANPALAAQTTITGDQSLSGDYSGNTGATAINIENALGSNPPYHTVTVTGDISANTNSFGIYAGAGTVPYNSSATFTGATGNEVITTNYNTNAGIIATGTDGSKGVDLKFKDVNIVSRGNATGILAQNGGKLSFESTGTKGTQSIIVGATPSDDGTIDDNDRNAGEGISSLGSGTIITIKDMDIYSIGNKGNGIHAAEGGKIAIIGSGDGNTLTLDENEGSAGVYVGENSSLTIENMNITSAQNGDQPNALITNGIYINGGTATVTGNSNGNNSFVSELNHGAGIYVDNNGDLEVRNMDITIDQNNTNNIFVDGDGVGESAVVNITGSANGNTLIAKDGNESGIVAENYGALNVTNMNVDASGHLSTGMYASSGGKLTIDGGAQIRNLTIKDNEIFGVTSRDADTVVELKNLNIEAANNGYGGGYGLNLFETQLGGKFTLDNTTVTIDKFDREGNEVTDVQNLYYAQNGQGTFNATNSTISNSILTVSGGISNVNFTGTNWKMLTNSNITNLNTTNSNIDLRNETAGTYNTLTINNLTSDNTVFDLNTYLDGDGTNTDKITISESSQAGNAILNIHSTGATDQETTSNGIMVVDQSQTTSANTNFSLNGGVLDNGYWEYGLYEGDINSIGNDWYLRTNGQRTNVANTIANMPAVHLSIIKTGMNELRKRLGDLRENDPNRKNGAWVRSYAKNLTVDENIHTDLNLYGMEAGYDFQVYNNAENKAYLGIMAGYLYTDNIRTKQTNGAKGRGHASTPSVGLYGTWINHDGWFADGTMRYFWSNMKTNSYNAQGNALSFKPDLDFITGSIELGRRFEYKQDSNSKYIIEPKVEMQYAHAGSESTRIDSTNAKINYGDTDSLSGRFGIMLGYSKKLQNNSVIEPFVQASVIQEWDGTTNIRYSNVDFKSDISGTSFEFGGGLNAKLNNSFNIYSDVMYEKGNVVEAFSGNLGVRYNF